MLLPELRLTLNQKVAFDQLQSYPNGRRALDSYRKLATMESDSDYVAPGFSGQVRNRKHVQDSDSEVNVDADGDKEMLDRYDANVRLM